MPNPALDTVIQLTGADTPVHPSSAVKAGWGKILREVARHGEVIVTSHNRPQAVVVDIETYKNLVRRAQANDPLQALQAEFDRKLAAFNTAGAGDRLRTVAGAGILAPATRKAVTVSDDKTKAANR